MDFIPDTVAPESAKRDDMKNVVLPDDRQRRLIFYLAMEEYIAGTLEEDAFFVWQSEPTVIIGRNQILENEVNLDYCREHSVQVYRRKSGGGCVYSDKGNIMMSYISRRGNVQDVFDAYLSSLTECLRSLGLPAVKSGRNDVLVEGRKVSGNAFQQLPDRSIVHGTLLYSVDMEALAEAIRPPVEKLARHGVESVRQRVRNISDWIAGREDVHAALLSTDALKDRIISSFCDGTVCLTAAQVAGIERIEDTYKTL